MADGREQEGRGADSAEVAGRGSPSPPDVARESFRKADRIVRSVDFRRIQDHGRKFHSPRLVVAWSEGAADRTRLGLTVSRKVGNAVVRASVKRRIREIFRRNRSQWPLGVDLVVIARSAAASAPFEALREDLFRWARGARPRGGKG